MKKMTHMTRWNRSSYAVVGPRSRLTLYLGITLATMSLLSPRVTASNADCTNTMPGLDKMLRGVDITQLDLTPVNVLASNGFMHMLVKFTCNLNRTWLHPDNTRYQLPDQVWRLTTQPAGWAATSTSIMRSTSDVRSSMAISGKIDGNMKKFAFSASASYKESEKKLTKESSYIAETSSAIGNYRVDFKPYWVLEMDDYVQTYVEDMLTGTFDSNPQMYNEFIQLFGTHYLSTANFGGYIKALFKIKETSRFADDDTKLQGEIQASYMKFLSGKGEGSYNKSSTEDKFNKETSRVIKYFGGESSLMEEDLIKKWLPTVERDPWLFSGHLVAISNLIKDKTKKIEMTKAVRNYVLQSFLASRHELALALKASGKNIGDVLDKITKARSNGLSSELDEGDVEEIGGDIDKAMKSKK